MSPMRVIAGEARGQRLKLVPGESTRPITDRVKEALFNILGGMVLDSAFLDLFAGTGSVGIEALSRGAARATFVDRSRAAIDTIGHNLATTGLKEYAEVIRADAFEYLNRNLDSGFDLIYVAPPQYKGLWQRTLAALDQEPTLLNPDAWIMVQIDPVEAEAIELTSLFEFDRRKYGSTELIFYEHSSP